MSDKKDDKMPTQPVIKTTSKLYENSHPKPTHPKPSDKKDK